jgi:2-polyprenyl-3-methyl-5-hydroxy-6-metoxy-1,4-benzoquinol methylase
MDLTGRQTRQRAYGQDQAFTRVDRFGVWLSSRQINRHVPTFANKRVADVGCGYQARFARTLLDRVQHLTLLDVALDPSLKADPKVTAIEGLLPDALSSITKGDVDILICNSVLEHLWDPSRVLAEFRRTLAVGGMALINVPSWRGKYFLELSAFRLGRSPAEEMNDHKMYYDPRDLWPLLVQAGFMPRDIRCFRHKFGLNTFAVCKT